MNAHSSNSRFSQEKQSNERKSTDQNRENDPDFNDTNIVQIDGSLHEGGGQILRNSLTLSALTGVPVNITNIRKGRGTPGLRPQHLAGVKLLTRMCGASVEGDKIGSTNLYFTPHHVSGGEYVSEVGTAGSVCLVLQVALPAALFADDTTNLRIIGGTNCEMAPQIDFMTEVFKPNLEDFGCTFDFNLFRRGYFPKGGGKIVVNVPPISFLNSIEKLDQGNVASICGWAYVAGKVPIRAAHDMAKAAIDVLRREYPNVAINIERYQEAPAMAEGNGSGIILVCKTTTGCVLGGSAIGNNRKCSASESGRLAALELLEDLQSGACVDRYVQDMIIVLIALSKGKSRIRVGEITLHTKSAMYVAESITQVPFNIIEDGTTNIIEIEGIGLSNVN